MSSAGRKSPSRRPNAWAERFRTAGDQLDKPANNSPAATNVTATFSAVGSYVIRMACVDKSILDAVTWQWGFAPEGSRIYTNLIGAVCTNLTVTVRD